MAEALSPSDLSAIQAERGPVHMHVGGVLRVRRARSTRETVVERLRERIHLIPRYTMRLEGAPLGLANPVWVGRRVLRPRPPRAPRRAAGARAATPSCASSWATILSERLDRARPLWQLTVVEGLEGGRTAIVARMHHALVDGIAAVDVSTVILDPTPEGLDLPPPRAEGADRAAAGWRGWSSSPGSPSAQLELPRKLAREAVTRTLDPRDLRGQVRSAAGRSCRRARARAPARRPTRG